MGNIKKTFLHKTLRIAALFIGGIAIGFGVGFVIGKIIKPALHADISAADIFLTILLAAIFFILSFIIHIVIHEAGHMLAAMARGWKFLSFMIMGVVLSPSRRPFPSVTLQYGRSRRPVSYAAARKRRHALRHSPI